MGLTIRIHHPSVRTEPTGQGQRRAVAEQSSSEVVTCASSSESMIRKSSSSLDAVQTVGDSPGGAPMSPSAVHLLTPPGTEHTPMHANDAQSIHLSNKGAHDVSARGRDLSPRSESEPGVDRQGQTTHPGTREGDPRLGGRLAIDRFVRGADLLDNISHSCVPQMCPSFQGPDLYPADGGHVAARAWILAAASCRARTCPGWPTCGP